MATLNYFLDQRRQRKDGTCQLKLVVNNSEGNRLISVGISLDPIHWDAEAKAVKPSHPLRSRLDLMLRRSMLDAEEALLSCSRTAPLDDLRDAVAAALFPERAKPMPKDLVADVARRFSSLKAEASTRMTYERTIKHLETFRPGVRFGDVTRSWLMEFDAHMAQFSPSPNSRAIHMRNLRAIFNFAIDEGLTSNYPFRKFRIKTVKTAKRNLHADDMRRVITLDVEDWQRQYRDFFALSFLLIGVNAKDLLRLKPADLKDGRIVFNRAKTKKLYSIKVEPEAQSIIDRYAGSGHLLKVMDSRTDYLQYIRDANHALKTLGQKCRKGCKPAGEPLFPELTTYWARHSWATIAASLDIPKETIAAALGHDMGNSTTAIYIDFDRSKVDEANRRVIDWVLYGKK